MSVMTVLGPIEKADLGIVLPHEHIFLDLTNQFVEPDDPESKLLSREKIRLDNYGLLRRNPYAIKDNLILDDLDTAVKEIEFFSRLEGRTIVDCTSVGIARSPVLLRRVAEQTGVNIVAGCGYYTYDTHPEDMNELSVETIAECMIRDITVGIDDTGIRSGVIGEIGTSDPIHPQEAKSLVAAVLASQSTGTPIQVHTYPWGKQGIEAVQILAKHGAALNRVAICHVDVVLNIEYIQALLDMGVFVQFDNFGKEFHICKSDRRFAGGTFATDIERVKALKYLIDRSYEKQILVSNDICLKQMLHRYGGWGYDHLIANIVPMMLDEGISEGTVDVLLRDNPANWLNV